MKLRAAKVGAVAGVLSACMLLAACGVGGSSASGQETRHLLLGHGAAPGNPRSIAADDFAKEVAKLTHGRIEVQVQGDEQLGSDDEMLQSVRSGTLDLTANSQGPLSSYVPQVALIGLPFLFDDPEQAYKVLDGKVGEELAGLAEKKGFKVLAWWDNGIRDLTNNVRPINTPADLKGLKIRTPDDPMTVDIFNALHANPTPLAFSELYLALRQGTVDGQENPLVNIDSSKLYEVQKYLALTGHKYEATPFVMNLKTWDSLSPADQKAIQKAADDARDEQRSLMGQQEKTLEKKLATKMQVTTPDKDAFRAATKGVYDKWAEKYPDLVKALEDAANS